MTEKRILALLGFLLGLLSALLILAGELRRAGNQTIDLDFVLDRMVGIVLGIVILLGSLLIYRSTSSSGGFVNLFIGIIALLFVGTLEAILAIISGILGLIAAGTLR